MATCRKSLCHGHDGIIRLDTEVWTNAAVRMAVRIEWFRMDDGVKP